MKHFGTVLSMAAFLAFAPLAGAQEKKAGDSSDSRETRSAMAAAHKKMAECLESNRSFSECRDEMRESMRGNDDFGCGWGMMRGRGNGPKKFGSGRGN